MNTWTGTGRLGRDPETRYTSGERAQAVTNFSMAVEDRRAKPDAPPMWLNVTAWAKLAEIVGKALHKGSRVLVSGRLQIRPYKAKDGQEKQSVEVVADSIEFLDPKPKTDEQDQRPATEDEDLPF